MTVKRQLTNEGGSLAFKIQDGYMGGMSRTGEQNRSRGVCPKEGDLIVAERQNLPRAHITPKDTEDMSMSLSLKEQSVGMDHPRLLSRSLNSRRDGGG